MYRGYKKKKTKLSLYITFSVLLVFCMLVLGIFEFRIRPIIQEVASSRAKNIAVRVISNVVNDTMAKADIKYTDLVSFQKNGEQNITAVTSDIVGINKLKSTLSVEIEKKISDIDTMSTKIPIAETIIVGSVPETYTNVEGQQSPEDAVLNLLPD